MKENNNDEEGIITIRTLSFYEDEAKSINLGKKSIHKKNQKLKMYPNP